MHIDLCLDPYLAPEQITELGLLAEQHGFRAVWTPSGDDVRDPFATFAQLAAASSMIRIGVMALSPFEMHPYRLGTSLLTLNEMSGGRAEIAVGAGHDVAKSLGLEITRPVKHLRECLDILNGMAHQRPFSYAGDLYQLHDYDAPWISASPPAIHACAMGPQMLRMATAVASGVLFSDFTPTIAGRRLELVRKGLADRGRNADEFDVSTYLAVSMSDHLSTAQDWARSLIYWRALWRTEVTDEFLTADEQKVLAGRMEDLHLMARSGGRQTSVSTVSSTLLDRCVENLTVVATFDDPSPLTTRLLQFKEAGISRVMLGIDHDADKTIRVLGERVLPQVDDRAVTAVALTQHHTTLGERTQP